MSEYVKTVEDELDWSLLNQLHAVVLQIGTFCFRTKQICLTVLVAVIGVIITLSSNKLGSPVFITGFAIPILFWFLDSVAYFYQVKLRGVMDGVRDRIYKRHSKELLLGINSEVIEDSRTGKNTALRVKDAFFNHSMWLYFILMSSNLFLWILYISGVIS